MNRIYQIATALFFAASATFVGTPATAQIFGDEYGPAIRGMIAAGLIDGVRIDPAAAAIELRATAPLAQLGKGDKLALSFNLKTGANSRLARLLEQASRRRAKIELTLRARPPRGSMRGRILRGPIVGTLTSYAELESVAGAEVEVDRVLRTPPRPPVQKP